jgi:RNA polymerase sigma factor (sigma-70 family)
MASGELRIANEQGRKSECRIANSEWVRDRGPIPQFRCSTVIVRRLGNSEFAIRSSPWCDRFSSFRIPNSAFRIHSLFDILNSHENVHESVKELTARIASGDSEAFARFFRWKFDEMYAEVRRATGRDESFCLDVVQDAMLRVVRSIKPFVIETELQAWLRIVVQTCAYDRLRQELRRRRRERAAGLTSELRSAQGEDEEKLRWLRKEIENMDAAHARLLVMRYRWGWTLERIGTVLGIKPGAVDGRLNRLVALLRRRAKETYHD